VVSILGLKRRTADYASGKVTFSRTTPAPADITIPIGTIITGPTGATTTGPTGATTTGPTGATTTRPDVPNFETIESATLAKGKKEVEVAIRATIPGEKGKVGAGTLTIMPKPVFGIEKVINEAATELGISDETDDQLRARAKKALQGAGKATVGMLSNLLLCVQEPANTVMIDEMPQGIPGEVNVVIDCADEKKAKIREELR
jgi:uncharacterized phage protein gp47/JayE